MSDEAQDFLVRRNIERFTRLLASENDAAKRSTLKKLLRKEVAKQGSDPVEIDPSVRCRKSIQVSPAQAVKRTL